MGLKEVAVTAASAGDAHSLFLSADGAVFSCGRNQHGQTGRPDSSAEELQVARRIVGLDDVHVVAIAAGDSHSLMLSADGDVYGCGANAYGQLVRAGRYLVQHSHRNQVR
jgi:alpha-tubulin suppressor-like RCC1 family protein